MVKAKGCACVRIEGKALMRVGIRVRAGVRRMVCSRMSNDGDERRGAPSEVRRVCMFMQRAESTQGECEVPWEEREEGSEEQASALGCR